jgi:hypothetical protein
MPESVKVGPYEYRIVSDAAGHMAAEKDQGVRLDGRGSAPEQEIHVNPQQATMYQRSTMIHEILHQVFVVAGTGLDNEDEEKICRSLEGGLLGVLRDNPSLVAWLTAP